MRRTRSYHRRSNSHASYCIPEDQQKSLSIGRSCPYTSHSQALLFIKHDLGLDLMELSQIESVILIVQVHLFEDCFGLFVLFREDEISWGFGHPEREDEHCERCEMLTSKQDSPGRVSSYEVEAKSTIIRLAREPWWGIQPSGTYTHCVKQ